jgi:hypothetical protein
MCVFLRKYSFIGLLPRLAERTALRVCFTACSILDPIKCKGYTGVHSWFGLRASVTTPWINANLNMLFTRLINNEWTTCRFSGNNDWGKCYLQFFGHSSHQFHTYLCHPNMQKASGPRSSPCQMHRYDIFNPVWPFFFAFIIRQHFEIYMQSNIT